MGPGDTIADRFVIRLRAGSGGMGIVYQAEDRLTGQPVALKVLNLTGNAEKERFVREARLLADLTHPGIVRYVAHGTTPDGQPYLAMEWLEGETLAVRLAKEPLSHRQSISLACKAAETLGEAHRRGVVHRDVKPSNLFLPSGDPEQVMVLDFGIARSMRAVAVLTQTGVALGTPGYMAPEQVRGGRDVRASADVFALGCVLFECLARAPAFSGDHALAVLAKVLLEDPTPIGELCPGVPPALESLLARMLAKDPAERPPDCRVVAAELAGIELTNERPSHRPRAAAGLTDREQQLLSVVLASQVGPPAQTAEDGTAPTMADVPSARHERLVEVATSHGGQLVRLADGTVVVTLLASYGASDLAAQAARCGLALRSMAPPRAAIAIATGRGMVGARWPVGEAIDRAVQMVRQTRPDLAEGEACPIRIDDVTAGLLDVRFEVIGDRGGLLLRSERDAVDMTRTLNGKPTPFVGRDRELGALEAALAACVEESTARAVLVTGPAGVGKTRLRYEFVQHVGRTSEPPEIWLVRGDPLSAGAPFAMIAPAIRRAAGILQGEPIAVQRKKLVARVARHVAPVEVQRVAEFLGELAAVPFDDEQSVQLRSARRDIVLMGDQMRRAWEDLLAAECRVRPLVLIFDDLQWGDLPSVRFVDAALRNLADRPLLVVAFARPDVHDAFPGLWTERALDLIRLSELGKKTSERLVRQLLGDGDDPALVGKLVERAAGNPFAIEELVRAVAGGRGDEPPETVLAMVQARLGRLPDDVRRALRAASVFGHVFWRGGVRALLGGQSVAETDRLVEDLVQREVVAQRSDARFPAETEFVFRHALVQEAAYSMLTDSDRELGHALAADWLEHSGETIASVLAEHFDRGGQPNKAVAWYVRAAEQALEGNDFQAVLRWADRGLARGAEGEVEGTLWSLRASAHFWAGAPADAEHASTKAMALLQRGSAAWCSAAGELGVIRVRCGKEDELVELAHDLRDLLDHATPEPTLVRAAMRVAQQLTFLGRRELSEDMLDRIVRLAAPIEAQHPEVSAWLAELRSFRGVWTDDYCEYLRVSMDAARSYELAGDLRTMCIKLSNAASTLLDLGAYERAEEHLRPALAAAERIGIPLPTAVLRLNLAIARLRQGALGEARALATAAVVGFARQADKRIQGMGRAWLAQVALHEGAVDEAEREARLAVDLLAAAPPVRPLAYTALIEALLARRAVDEALEVAHAGMTLLEERGGAEEGEESLRIAFVEALLSADRKDEAVEALRRARSRLDQRAALITDPELRRSFLDRVPACVKTAALAAEWLSDRG